jgi:hypothetical protein
MTATQSYAWQLTSIKDVLPAVGQHRARQQQQQQQHHTGREAAEAVKAANSFVIRMLPLR